MRGFFIFDGGVVEQVKEKRKLCFIVFPRPHKTPSESKEIAVGTHDDLVGIVLLEALAWQLIAFGESDVRPRHFHRGRIGGPGRG